MNESEARIQGLDEATCHRLLAEHRFGRLAVVDEQGPMIFPVNYAVAGDRIVFRTEPGTKLQAADRGAPASFEIDDVDESRRFGWDVVVRGTLARLDDEETASLEAALVEPFPGGRREHLIALETSSVSGRRVPLPPDAPDDWYRPPDLGHIWYGQDASDLMG